MEASVMADPADANFADPGKLQSYLYDRRLEEVEGWLQDGAADLTFLLSERQLRLGVGGDVAEIGVHHGKYLILLALLSRAHESIFAIDVFEHQQHNVDGSGLGDYERFSQNFQSLAPNTAQLRVIKKDSLMLRRDDFYRGQPGGVRLFSVDGGHTPHHTQSDIALAFQVLGRQGIVIVDDFYNPDWPGVQEGVHRILTERSDIHPLGYGNNKLFLCRADERSAYETFFCEELPEWCLAHKRVQLHGRSSCVFEMNDLRLFRARDLVHRNWAFSFGHPGGEPIDLETGWSSREDSGTWMSESTAKFTINLPPEVLRSARNGLAVSIYVHPFLPVHRRSRLLAIGQDGVERFREHLSQGTVVRLVLDADQCRRPISLMAISEDLETPGRGDNRKLAHFFSKLLVEAL